MARLEQIVSLNTLNRCSLLCTKQSRWKDATQRYLANMLINNIQLQDDVIDGSYSVMPTTDFDLNERGHMRKIEAPAIRDKNLQKALTINVLLPNIRPYLIYDNYASLKNRGTSFARKRFEILLRKYVAKHGVNGYGLFIDIKKYFESIPHSILKQRMEQRLSNESEEIRRLVNYIIDKTSHTDRGVNLGGEAPQIFAVDYLTPMDNYIKIVKGIKYYGRYMDDAFLFDVSKSKLKALRQEIENILASLGLELNKKKTRIAKISNGFVFLQIKYNVFPSGKILKRPTHSKIVRERRRLKGFRRLLDKGVLDAESIQNCYLSWRGTMIKDHNACDKTIKAMDDLYHKLFPEPVKKEKEKRSVLVKKINRKADTEDLKYLFDISRVNHED